jgi:hypothetical protein
MANVAPIRVPMTKSKATKRTTVYTSDADGAAITQLYIVTETLPDPAPDAIVVTVTVG